MSPLLRRIIFAVLFALGIGAPLIGEITGVRLLAPAAHELSRAPSPDSLHDVVVVMRQSMLPYTRPVTEVYVVSHGLKITPSDKPVLNAIRAEGVQSVWRDDHLLEIRYAQARVNNFTSVWPANPNATPSVEIRLRAPAKSLSFTVGDDSEDTPFAGWMSHQKDQRN
jgi:hypothetical protein